MKNPTDHISNHAASIRLTAEEREHMKTHLLAHMRAHPLPTPSPFLGMLSPIQSSALRPYAFALILLLAVGGTTAFAAEGALPGDALYGVKVAVVEPALGAFQLSDEAKASWRVHLLDRRLSEASELATKERLGGETADALSAEIASAAEDASAHINTLDKKNPGRGRQLSAELEATIEVHAPALLRLDAALAASSTASSTEASTTPEKEEGQKMRRSRIPTISPTFLDSLPGNEGTSAGGEDAPDPGHPMLPMPEGPSYGF